MKYTAIGENHLYSKAYAKGKKCVTDTVVVYVLPDLHAARLKRSNPQKQKINRIGLTVTKKIGGAVTRNRVKRIIREAYRSIDCSKGVRCGFLVVIVARNKAVMAKSNEVEKDLLYALDKLNMLHMHANKNNNDSEDK